MSLFPFNRNIIHNNTRLLIRSHHSPSGAKNTSSLTSCITKQHNPSRLQHNNKTWPTLGKRLSFGEVARTSKEFFIKARCCLWSWVVMCFLFVFLLVFFALMGRYHSAANSCRYWLMLCTFVAVPGSARLIIHQHGLNPRSSWVGANKRQRNLWKLHLKGLFLKEKKTSFSPDRL